MHAASPVADALDKIGPGRWQLLICLYAALYLVADAAEAMVMTYLSPAVQCYWGVSPAQASLISSAAFIGQFFGFLLAGSLSDVLGRHRVLLGTAVQLLAFSALSGLAPGYRWLVACRILVGLSMGSMPVVETLAVEFLPAANRGRYLLLVHCFWSVGTIFMGGLAWAVLPTLGFRALLALSVSPALLILCTCWLVPESPMWLHAQGRVDEAAAVLRRVARVNGFQGTLSFRDPLAVEPLPASSGAGEQQDEQALLPRASTRRHSARLAAREEGRASGSSVELMPRSRSGRSGSAEAAAAVQAEGAAGGSDASLKHFLGDEGPGGQASGSAAGTEAVAGVTLRPSPFSGWPRQRSQRRGSLEGRVAQVAQAGSVASSQLRPAATHSQASLITVTWSERSVRLRAESQRRSRRLGQRSAWQQLVDAFDLQALWRHTVSDLRQMFRREGGWLWISLAMVFVWVTSVTAFYGTSLLLSYLQMEGQDGGLACKDGKPDLPASRYRDVFLSTTANFVGLVAVACLVETRLGRKWLMVAGSVGAGACMLRLTADLPHRAVLIWLTRGFATGSGTLVGVMTPECYPTSIRGFALGLCSSLARWGGFSAPFVFDSLHSQGKDGAALLLLAVLYLAAGAGAIALPDRTGQSLEDD